MLQQFKDYIRSEKLLPENGKTLLAVSGGVDSVVMTDLYYRAGFPAEVAHCNFKLRGHESDADEDFVRRVAEGYHMDVYVKSFDTKAYADTKGISIQMAARELRYQWFEELLDDTRLERIATGHHLDDAIETFFINLLRGTGIRGFHGILPRQNNIVHPLLFARRNEIEKYQRHRGLSYREDSSNISDKYKRNQVRHHVLPALEKMQEDYRRIFSENFERIRQAEEIFRQKVQEEFQKIHEARGEEVYFDINKLRKLHPLETYLFEFLAPYNFHYREIKKVVASLDAIPGKKFYSDTHLLIKDRRYLIVTTRKTDEADFYTIEKNDTHLSQPVPMRMTTQPFSSGVVISGKTSVAMLDYDKLRFPLRIRKWERGDRFRPLGMKQQKKLSDFFIDEKFSLLEKEQTWLLLSGTDIVWVINQRIDDRYKITENTKTIFRIELLDEEN